MNVFIITSFCSLILNTLSFVSGVFAISTLAPHDCERKHAPMANNLSGSNGGAVSHYSNFLSSYFSNLVDNIGQNVKGTCGYVAIGMLLSYYDTYLDDNIIPENYDVVSEGQGYNLVDRHISPGIANENLDEQTYNEMTTEEYMQYMATNYSSTHLHSKLLSIGLALGKSNGIYMNEISEILHHYLTIYLNYTDQDFETSGVSNFLGIGVREYAIQKVQEGYPVMIVAYKSLVEGHVVIAHDYNSETNELYVNYGYTYEFSTRKTLEEDGYTRYTNAMIIDWNFDNSNRGHNYKVGNQSYRYDNLLLEHRHHSNSSLAYSYIANDINHHNVSYSCGYSGIESHGNFYSNFPNPTVTCGLCGYNLMNIEEEHEII